MPKKMKYLIAILGPTAVGKSKLAVRLAKATHTEVLSFDSRQFFKEMNIGTAKVTAEEMAGIPHHFISHRSIHDDYSAGDFEREAVDFLKSFYQKNDFIIGVGGSGLYLDALEFGLDRFPEVTLEARQQVQAIEIEGIKSMQKALKARDPIYFKEVDLQNPARLRRALEVCFSGDKPYSAYRKKEAVNRDFQVIRIGLEMNRETLYERINHRVEQMISDGLIEEAKSLYACKNLKPLQTVGYQEFFDHWDGKWSEETAIEKVKQHSRNYAKRQMTWFRKNAHIKWFSPDAFTSIMTYLSAEIDGLEKHF